MEQLDLFGRSGQTAQSVSDLTEYIKRLLEGDDLLADVWVQGEVSTVTLASSGHLYFSLKDDLARIRCVMWKPRVAHLERIPEDGQSVVAHGSVGVYEAQGSYQLYVDLIQRAGLGLLYLELEALKRRLAAEGLFAPERKRALPPFPHVIGVATSPTGAAIRDILSVLSRRFPLATVLLAPTQVQGDGAPRQITDAIDMLNRHGVADVIIVARGGGSPEELWAFNDERVVRAIFSSRIPVVTGVGHETDFTLADLVADVRAPTPSAAAELVAPDIVDLGAGLASQKERLSRAMHALLDTRRGELDGETRVLERLSPMSVVASRRLMVDELTARVEREVAHGLTLQSASLCALVARLESLSPYATLSRGYAIVSRVRDGRVVTGVADVIEGDRLLTRVRDGSFTSCVDRQDRVGGN